MKAITVICMLLVAIGGFAMIETLSLEQLTGGSDCIVKGKITAIKGTGKLPEGPEILACLFEIDETLKGELKAGESIKIKNYRGIEDYPEFKEGAPYLLFLKKAEGHFELFNGVQGSWPIDTEGRFQAMGYGKTLEQVKAVLESIPLKQPKFQPLTF